MKINIRKLVGCWDLGYALDKHILESVYLGDNEYGHPTFDTTRSEMGEALFQLKYRSQQKERERIAEQMAKTLPELFPGFDILLPMPPSIQRRTQPVPQITKALADKLRAPYRDDLLVKTSKTPQMKDIAEAAAVPDGRCRRAGCAMLVGGGTSCPLRRIWSAGSAVRRSPH